MEYIKCNDSVFVAEKKEKRKKPINAIFTLLRLELPLSMVLFFFFFAVHSIQYSVRISHILYARISYKIISYYFIDFRSLSRLYEEEEKKTPFLQHRLDVADAENARKTLPTHKKYKRNEESEPAISFNHPSCVPLISFGWLLFNKNTNIQCHKFCRWKPKPTQIEPREETKSTKWDTIMIRAIELSLRIVICCIPKWKLDVRCSVNGGLYTGRASKVRTKLIKCLHFIRWYPLHPTHSTSIAYLIAHQFQCFFFFFLN